MGSLNLLKIAKVKSSMLLILRKFLSNQLWNDWKKVLNLRLVLSVISLISLLLRLIANNINPYFLRVKVGGFWGWIYSSPRANIKNDIRKSLAESKNDSPKKTFGNH